MTDCVHHDGVVVRWIDHALVPVEMGAASLLGATSPCNPLSLSYLWCGSLGLQTMAVWLIIGGVRLFNAMLYWLACKSDCFFSLVGQDPRCSAIIGAAVLLQAVQWCDALWLCAALYLTILARSVLLRVVRLGHIPWGPFVLHAYASGSAVQSQRRTCSYTCH